MCRSPARGDGIFIAEIYYCGVASEMDGFVRNLQIRLSFCLGYSDSSYYSSPHLFQLFFFIFKTFSGSSYIIK